MKVLFRAPMSRLFERQVRRLIRSHNLKVVAVAGSVGKTGTRNAVATVLAEKYVIQKLGRLGYNSELGLPLSVFGMDTPGWIANPFAWIWRIIRTERIIRGSYLPQVLVLELGTDHPGEIGRYLKYITPDLGIMTAVTPEHMQNFPGGLAQVAAEELLLASVSRQFLATQDDIPAFYRHKYIDHHPDRHYYGMGPDAEYGITMAQDSLLDDSVVTITKNSHARLKHVTVQLKGESGAKAVIAAYATGDLLGLSAAQLKTGIAKIKPVSGRMNILSGLNGSTIIDDTYNSSPQALKAALLALARTASTGRRIAVLGSMNELGSDAPKYHTEAGILASQVDLLVTIGGLANKYLGPAAVQSGLDPTRYKPADSPYAAGEYLKLVVKPGDVILVKGSQNGVFAEEAVALILQNSSDKSRLVRQSSAWLRDKARQFTDASA
jgi:UDP-N-acetylmuramoyl-tripeptide--D-alanyl-D-alanine ligase